MPANNRIAHRVRSYKIVHVGAGHAREWLYRAQSPPRT